MKKNYVFPYYNEKYNLLFFGAYYVTYNNKFLFIEKNGHIFLSDINIGRRIINGDIDEDISLKLLQRGFACILEKKENKAEKAEEIFSVDIKPTFFMIDMTKKCNMRCKYCLRDEYEEFTDGTISDKAITEISRYIADYCHQSGVDNIIVQPWGGEPLFEKDKIFLLQDELNKQGINHTISVETNGLLLTDELIDELWRRKINIGISIDGPKEIHDSQRVMPNGKFSHVYVENALRRAMARYEGKISVIATITKRTYDRIEDIIDYFVYDLGLTHFKLNYVHKSSFMENDDMCLNPEKISECSLRILNKIVDMHEKGRRVYEYNIYTKLLNVLSGRLLDACISRGCLGGKRMITFDMQGNIFPCDVTDYPEEMVGSIYSSESLTDLICEAARHKPYFSKKSCADCEDCAVYCYCRGGCSVHMKCCGYKDVDLIECSVNKAVYPEIFRLILEKPDIANRIADCNIL